MPKINNITKRILYSILSFCIFSSLTFSDYNKILLSGNEKYKKFMLTEDIYRNSNTDFSDIRILNSKDEEIPYVIISGEDYANRTEDFAQEYAQLIDIQPVFKIISAKEPYITGYIDPDKDTLVEIITDKIPLYYMTLDIDSADYKRDYFVNKENFDSKIDFSYLDIKGIIYRIGDKSENTIDLNKIKNEKMYLLIKNGDDKPLSINKINAYYYPNWLIFRCDDPNGKYRVIYGDKEKNAPKYDIKTYYDSIEKIDTVHLDIAQKDDPGIKKDDDKKDNLFNNDFLYRIFIGLIAVLLIVYMIKVIKSKNKEN